ncbi:glycosyltransferase [Psychroserpens sp.]|uniref:glycosyltransferase n=1 Tax=Psychroserpens sp. TaxID=2020870 RepID=UPI0038586230
MTLVHLITGLGGGGAEHMVLELSKTAQSRKTKTIVISITNSNTIESKFIDNQIEYHFLGINSLKNFKNGFATLKHLIKDQNEIVFHCHMFHSCMLGIIFKLFYKNIPIVFTMHTNSVKQLYRRLLLFFAKPFRKSDIIFSENSKKWYLKNSIVIPNGVDFEKFKLSETRTYDKAQSFSFLFLGRLFEPKNPLFLVTLAKSLKESKIHKFTINIVGDGPMKNQLELAIKNANVSDHFVFHGFNNNVIPFLHQSHCLILPSLWEGMPVTIIESAASKLPIITTPVGSIPDFLNESNAFVRNQDNFHNAMIEVVNNYDTAIAKANKLYSEMASVFNIENIYTKHETIYNSVSSSKS